MLPTLAGYLFISGSDADDTFIAGSGGSLFVATLGDDEYTFGSGIDTIFYTSTQQSAASDTINSFDVAEDKIDLSFLATPTFDWQSNDAFADNSGVTQARYDDVNTLQIDVDGDSFVDMTIQVVGVAGQLDVGNFVV